MAARPEAFDSVMIFIQMTGETVFVKGGQLLRERERTKTVRGDQKLCDRPRLIILHVSLFGRAYYRRFTALLL